MISWFVLNVAGIQNKTLIRPLACPQSFFLQTNDVVYHLRGSHVLVQRTVYFHLTNQ